MVTQFWNAAMEHAERPSPALLLAKTREQLTTWTTQGREQFEERRDVIIGHKDRLLEQGEAELHARRDALLERRDALVRQTEEVGRLSRETLLNVEATALEGARDILVRVEDSVGPRASFLRKGREALDDAIVQVRSSYAGGLGIADYDDLSIKRITPHLETLDGTALRTLRAYEAENKNRKTLLKLLDERLLNGTAEA